MLRDGLRSIKFVSSFTCCTWQGDIYIGVKEVLLQFDGHLDGVGDNLGRMGYLG